MFSARYNMEGHISDKCWRRLPVSCSGKMARSSSPDHLHPAETFPPPSPQVERQGGGVPGGAFCPLPRRSPVKCWTPLIFAMRSLGWYRFNSGVPPNLPSAGGGASWKALVRCWAEGRGYSQGQTGGQMYSLHKCLQTLEVLHSYTLHLQTPQALSV